MPLAPTLTIQGAEIRRIGFGTWQITGRRCVEAVRDALDLGYRHLDTAAAYENEAEVGQGLRDSGVAREDVWITTKVWMSELEPDRLRASAERSVQALSVDQVDLLLIHWPNTRVPLERTLEAMTAARDDGLVGHIGLSNFPAGMMRRAIELAPIFANQVEYHPFLGQDELLEICREHDVLLEAYAPFAHGKLFGDPTLGEIAERLGRTVGQVALRWLVEQDHVCALPKAASHDNRAANIDVFDFDLSAEDRARIDALPKDRREFSPAWAPDWAA